MKKRAAFFGDFAELIPKWYLRKQREDQKAHDAQRYMNPDGKDHNKNSPTSSAGIMESPHVQMQRQNCDDDLKYAVDDKSNVSKSDADLRSDAYHKDTDDKHDDRKDNELLLINPSTIKIEDSFQYIIHLNLLPPIDVQTLFRLCFSGKVCNGLSNSVLTLLV